MRPYVLAGRGGWGGGGDQSDWRLHTQVGGMRHQGTGGTPVAAAQDGRWREAETSPHRRTATAGGGLVRAKGHCEAGERPVG